MPVSVDAVRSQLGVLIAKQERVHIEPPTAFFPTPI